MQYDLLPKKRKKKLSTGIRSVEHSFYECSSESNLNQIELTSNVRPYFTEPGGSQNYVYTIISGTPGDCTVVEERRAPVEPPKRTPHRVEDIIDLNNTRNRNKGTFQTGKFKYVIFFINFNGSCNCHDSCNYRDNDIFFAKLGYRADIVVQPNYTSDLIVPYGTECFCFLETDMQLDEVRKKFTKRKNYYELGLPIKNNTLYAVYDMNPNSDKRLDREWHYNMEINKITLTQEINGVVIDKAFANRLKRPKKPTDIKERFSKCYYGNAYEEVILYYNGSICAASANWEFGGSYYLENNYDYVLRTIETVSRNNPEIYEAIAEHIPFDVENPNYKLLREYCIGEINKNYQRAEEVLRRVRKP